MAPRPFPLPLRVGVDMCNIPRIKGVIGINRFPASRTWQRFVRRLLTPREGQYFKKLFVGPQMHEQRNSERAANFLAGRWAAKEACIKAVKPRKVTPMEIEVWPQSDKETYAIILDEPAGLHGLDMWETFKAKDISRAANSASKEKHIPVNPYELVPSHEDVKGQIARLSISHDGDYACAVAMVMSEPAPGDVGGEGAARQPSGE